MRKLLMALVVVAVVAVVGGITAGIVWWQRQTEVPSTETVQPTTAPISGGLTPAEESEVSAQRLAAADDDGDGLNNSEEARWASNPDNPDTDGDGYLDGEEIAAGHDPTVPAPNDLLSGERSSASAQEQVPTAPLEPQQYFIDDLDFTSGGRNFTQDFEREYAAPDRSPATMSEFAQAQPIIDRLPRPSDNEIPEGRPDTAGTLANYLAVVDNQNALANPSFFLQAQFELVERSDASMMQSLALVIRIYRQKLLETAVPAAALPLHTLLLGHTAALAATIDQIALYEEDPVKSMVATRQFEVLDRTYYPLISAEFARLRALQGTLAGP